MKQLILATILFASAFANAEGSKIYNVITKQTEVLSVLTDLLKAERLFFAQQTGERQDFTALALTGYQVSKITFRDSFGDGKSCTADVVFSSTDKTSNQLVSFEEIKDGTDHWSIFVRHCK